MSTGLDAGLMLDRQWHVLRGTMQQTKEPTLLAVAKILDEAGVLYAIVDGVAVQIHLPEPRTTLDIDIAVAGGVPRGKLIVAGFTLAGTFAHSEDWRGPDETPVQFTTDPALSGAISRADTVEGAGVRLRVIRRIDLLHEKLRSGSDPARRWSKRLQDLGDAEALLEADPSLSQELTPAERAFLDRLHVAKTARQSSRSPCPTNQLARLAKRTLKVVRLP